MERIVIARVAEIDAQIKQRNEKDWDYAFSEVMVDTQDVNSQIALRVASLLKSPAFVQNRGGLSGRSAKGEFSHRRGSVESGRQTDRYDEARSQTSTRKRGFSGFSESVHAAKEARELRESSIAAQIADTPISLSNVLGGGSERATHMR